MVTAFDRCQRSNKVCHRRTTVKKNRVLALRIWAHRSCAFRVPVERWQQRAGIVRQSIRPPLAPGCRSPSLVDPSVHQRGLKIESEEVDGRATPPSDHLAHHSHSYRICPITPRRGRRQWAILVEVRQALGPSKSEVPEQHLQSTESRRENFGDQRPLCL